MLIDQLKADYRNEHSLNEPTVLELRDAIVELGEKVKRLEAAIQDLKECDFGEQLEYALKRIRTLEETTLKVHPQTQDKPDDREEKIEGCFKDVVESIMSGKGSWVELREILEKWMR